MESLPRCPEWAKAAKAPKFLPSPAKSCQVCGVHYVQLWRPLKSCPYFFLLLSQLLFCQSPATLFPSKALQPLEVAAVLHTLLHNLECFSQHDGLCKPGLYSAFDASPRARRPMLGKSKLLAMVLPAVPRFLYGLVVSSALDSSFNSV